MLKFLSLLSLLILISLAILWDINKTPEIIITSGNGNIINYNPPQKIANLEFEDIHNTKFSLDDFQNKTILLNFWATWCLPCLSEIPDLIKLSKKEDIILIFISIADDKQKINEFLQKLNIEPAENIKWVTNNSTQQLFNIQKIPETIIIKNRQIIQKVIGVIKWQDFFI